jgi:hypothetical protein
MTRCARSADAARRSDVRRGGMRRGGRRLDRRRRVSRRLRILGVVATLAAMAPLVGCQGDEVPAAGAPGADADVQPELVDVDGLVARHEFLLPAPEDEVLAHLDAPVDGRAVVIPGPDGVDARVVWTGLPCQTAPSVEVTRDEGRLVVAVSRGPEVLGDADACPDTEDLFAIDLVLAGDHGIEGVVAHLR